MPSQPAQVPWPTNAMPGRWLGEAQGDLINAYAAKLGDVVRIRRTPGIKRWTPTVLAAKPDGSAYVPRGMHALRTQLLHVWDTVGYLTSSNGTTTPLTNPLIGINKMPVTIASNLRPSGEQVVICTDSQGPLIVNLATNTIEPYPSQPSAGMASMRSVEYYSGYFFFTKLSGEIWASDLQDIAVPDQSVATAEYVADDLLRCKSTGTALVVMSTRSIEFWVDVGNAPFPCIRQGTLDVGLLGRWCVAGGANEWENGLLWIAQDCSVRMLNGYNAQIVSTEDVARAIREYIDNPELLRTMVYTFDQQAIFSISSPTWTWEYNLTSSAWHRRDSYGLPHNRTRFARNFRNRWYAQDIKAGCLMEIDPNIFHEDGERYRWRVESAPMKEFPANVRLPSIDIDMTVGVGIINRPSPYETAPVVMVSWSHNGGANWSNPIARSMGEEGRYSTKVTVNGLGRSTSQGTRIRLDVVDPVLVSLQSAIATRARGSRSRAVNQ
jgi:hypothetical protein